MSILKSIKKSITKFERSQHEYKSSGAWDSEPCGIFKECLLIATEGSVNSVDPNVQMPSTREEWALYNVPSAKIAAKTLTRIFEKIVDAIKNCPSEEEYLAVREYIFEYAEY